MTQGKVICFPHHRRFGGLLCLLSALLCFGASLPAHANDDPDPQSFQTTISQVEYLDTYNQPAPPAPTITGRPLALPAKLLQGHDPGHGPMPVVYRWLRLRFDRSTWSDEPYGLYFPYLAAGSRVLLNGTQIGTARGLISSRHSCGNAPQLFSFPEPLLRDGANELLIRLPEVGGGTNDIDRAELGPEQMVQGPYQRQLWLQVLGIQVVSCLGALIGLLAAILWWRHRDDSVFGVYAMACAAWLVRNTQFFVEDPPIPADWFLAVTDAALFWLAPLLFILCFRILDRRFPRVEIALCVYVCFATLAAAVPRLDAWLMLVYALQGLCSLLFMIYLTVEAMQRRTVLIWLMWAAAMIATGAGLYDYALAQKWVDGLDLNLMPYSLLMFALTIGWALIDRFERAHHQLEKLNVDLESRIRQRERELGEHYARMTDLEQRQAVARERDRILRDMHDGLGLQLISSLHMAQRSDLSRAQTIELFDEALSELRIAIDSVKPTAADLLVMLGNLRFRIEPRLQSCGIELEWDIGETSHLTNLNAAHVAEITRIVQEAFTNVIKHAGASRLCVRVAPVEPDSTVIAVIDNGQGFDPATAGPGHGLSSMRSRARKIGASLTIQSRPGETTLALTI